MRALRALCSGKETADFKKERQWISWPAFQKWLCPVEWVYQQ